MKDAKYDGPGDLRSPAWGAQRPAAARRAVERSFTGPRPSSVGFDGDEDSSEPSESEKSDYYGQPGEASTYTSFSCLAHRRTLKYLCYTCIFKFYACICAVQFIRAACVFQDLRAKSEYVLEVPLDSVALANARRFEPMRKVSWSQRTHVHSVVRILF